MKTSVSSRMVHLPASQRYHGVIKGVFEHLRLVISRIMNFNSTILVYRGFTFPHSTNRCLFKQCRYKQAEITRVQGFHWTFRQSAALDHHCSRLLSINQWKKKLQEAFLTSKKLEHPILPLRLIRTANLHISEETFVTADLMAL